MTAAQPASEVTAAELISVVNMQAAELSMLRAIVLQLLHDSPASARAIVAHLVVTYEHPRPLPLPPDLDAMQARAVAALSASYRELLVADPAVRAALVRIEAMGSGSSQPVQMRDRLKVVPSSDQTEE